jgi:hypothetical protein
MKPLRSTNDDNPNHLTLKQQKRWNNVKSKLRRIKKLMNIRQKSNGQKVYGDMKRIVDQYHQLGHTFLNRGYLEYQIESAQQNKVLPLLDKNHYTKFNSNPNTIFLQQ